jgi:surface antigen
VVYAPPAVYAPPPVVYAQPAPLVVNPASAPYMANNGQTCREYQSTAVIAGARRPVYGTACLQPDGAWRIVN